MRSFRIFNVMGIRVCIHPTFFLLPLFFAATYFQDYGLMVAIRAFTLVLIVFACVLGHELTHSVAARFYGIRVPEITLYPIGGVASMGSIPKEPVKELVISAVGPAFNFVLAGVLYFPLLAWLGPDVLFSPSLASWPQTVANAFWINPLLGLFNLIPAFPMDGGRILRSSLAFKMSHRKATGISALVGQFFAIIFILLGFWKQSWMLAFVGLYVYISASNENRWMNRSNDTQTPG